MCDMYLSLLFFILCVFQLSTACHHGMYNVVVTRFLAKKGFHRDLITDMEWMTQENCSLLLHESLPRGLYVDLEQVKTYDKQFKIRSTSNVDVEAPAHKAVAQDLWIYPSPQQYTSVRKDYHSVSVILPVHIRYHKAPLTGQTSQTVTLEAPRILVKCNGKTVEDTCKIVQTSCLPAGSGEDLCDWIDIEQELPDIYLTVPVGDVNHRAIITIVTLLCAALGAIWVLSVTVRY